MVSEVEISTKAQAKSVAGLADGLASLAIGQNDGFEIYEMDWRTKINLQDAAAGSKAADGKMSANKTVRRYVGQSSSAEYIQQDRHSTLHQSIHPDQLHYIKLFPSWRPTTPDRPHPLPPRIAHDAPRIIRPVRNGPSKRCVALRSSWNRQNRPRSSGSIQHTQLLMYRRQRPRAIVIVPRRDGREVEGRIRRSKETESMCDCFG